MNEEPKQIKCYCGHTSYCDCSPLEEPKQETLEQASWRFNPLKKLDGEFLRAAFIKGAEWQQDRMYSEEEVRELFKQYKEEFSIYRNLQILNAQFEEWFEQFKKK